MIREFILMAFCIITICTNGQIFTRYMPIPPTSMQNSLGWCAPIVKTSDGGYLLNYSYGYPNWDVAGPMFSEIVKTDAQFTPLWRKELLGENGRKTLSFNDGTSIIYAKGNGVSIEKIDNQGQTLWCTKYSRTYPLSLTINNAITYSSDIKLAGCIMRYSGFGFWASYSPLILTIDNGGFFVQADSLVISTFSKASIDNIVNDPSGGYYIIGSGSAGGFLTKFTSSNTVAWCKKISSSGYSSTILNNGDLLLGGSEYNDSAGTGAIVLMRFSSSGNLIWAKNINYPSAVGGLQEISNGNILVTGIHRAALGDTLKNIILKIDANGNSIWTKRYGQGFSMSAAYQKTSNDWYFTAYTSKPILFNTDSTGLSNCSYSNFNLTLNNISVTVSPASCMLYPITITNTAVQANAFSDQPYYDSCSYVPTSVSEIGFSDKIQVYPNPSSGHLDVHSENIIDEIQITNSIGQTVHQFKPNDPNFKFELSNSGLYFIVITSNRQRIVKKIVVSR